MCEIQMQIYIIYAETSFMFQTMLDIHSRSSEPSLYSLTYSLNILHILPFRML